MAANYSVVEEDDQFLVKRSDGQVIGRHVEEEDADAQAKAMNERVERDVDTTLADIKPKEEE